jgi:ketosteroid isomerase-like protein
MRLTALLSLGLLAVACAPASETPAEAALPSTPAALSADDIAAVQAVEPAFVAAMNAGDTAAVLAFYADDAKLMPPDAPIIEGAGIRDVIVGMIQGGIADLVLTPTTTTGVGDLAYQVGTGSYAMGGETHEFKFVEVLRKGADGQWRYVVDMFSNLAPAE